MLGDMKNLSNFAILLSFRNQPSNFLLSWREQVNPLALVQPRSQLRESLKQKLNFRIIGPDLTIVDAANALRERLEGFIAGKNAPRADAAGLQFVSSKFKSTASFLHWCASFHSQPEKIAFRVNGVSVLIGPSSSEFHRLPTLGAHWRLSFFITGHDRVPRCLPNISNTSRAAYACDDKRHISLLSLNL